MVMRSRASARRVISSGRPSAPWTKHSTYPPEPNTCARCLSTFSRRSAGTGVFRTNRRHSSRAVFPEPLLPMRALRPSLSDIQASGTNAPTTWRPSTRAWVGWGLSRIRDAERTGRRRVQQTTSSPSLSTSIACGHEHVRGGGRRSTHAHSRRYRESVLGLLAPSKNVAVACCLTSRRQTHRERRMLRNASSSYRSSMLRDISGDLDWCRWAGMKSAPFFLKKRPRSRMLE